jgi:PKD repeat protein
MISLQLKRFFLSKLILATSVICSIGQTQAQTIFWSDNFDAPSGGVTNNNAGAGWTLNSEGNSNNRWFINIPSSIGCTSSGNVLHISCDGFLCGFLGGPNEPIYNAAASLTRTAASPVISTVGQSNVTLSFDYVCAGFAGSDFGTLALSSDGGSTWTDLPDQYVGTSGCLTKTITLPAQYLNIATFKMRFKWVENSASNGVDPPFSLDNIKLTAPTVSCTPPTVIAGSDVSICPGGSVTIGGAPTAFGGSEVGPFVYSWSNAGSLSSSSASNPTATPSGTTTYVLTVHRGTPSCSATSSVTVTVNTPQALTITPAGSLSICPGGNVGLTATAGFTNYSWSTPSGAQTGQSITATLAGNYTVSANGPNTCLSTSAAVVVTIGSVQSIAVTPSGPLTFCSGGSVILTAATGFGTYTWSDGTLGQSLTVTQSGTYNVIGSGSGCGGVSSDVLVVVNIPAILAVTADGPLQLCSGDDVILTAQSGFNNYVWSNAANGVSVTITDAGNYTVSADDVNGCQVVSTVQNVTQSPAFTLDVTPTGTISLCSGESILLTAESGYSNYVWSNATTGATLTLSSGGAYSVSAQDGNGCSGTSEAIIVNQTSVPDASFSYLQVVDLYTVNFTCIANAVSYLWDFGNNQTSTEANPSFTFPFDDTYPVTLILTNECGSDTVTINVVVIKTGIELLASFSSLNINPNPGSDFCQITGQSVQPQTISIGLYTLTGQQISVHELNVKGSFSIDLETTRLASGVYIIKIADAHSNMARKWSKL